MVKGWVPSGTQVYLKSFVVDHEFSGIMYDWSLWTFDRADKLYCNEYYVYWMKIEQDC